MNIGRPNTIFPPALLKFLGLVMLFALLSMPAMSQNTKGDRASSPREGRFKTPGKERQKGSAGKRVKTRRPSSPGGEGYTPRGRARGGERAGKPLRPVFSVKPPSNKQRAWRGDISGRRIRTKNYSSTNTRQNVYPQNGAGVKKNPPDRQGRQNVTPARRVPSRPGSSERASNVYPNKGNRYMNNSSPRPRSTERAESNSAALSRLRALQADGDRPKFTRRNKVVPRSASRAFVRNKSINVWARFKRPKRKGEQAQTTDIAGRRLRMRNFRTTGPGLVTAPDPYKYRGKSRAGRPSSGSVRPQSASGRRISARPLQRRPGGLGVLGLNATGNRKVRKSFPYQGGDFSGMKKTRRPAKGGGSVSGRLWNNGGRSLAGRNQGGANINAIPGNQRRRQNVRGDQGEEYSGSIKSRRPLRGGGSVSGRTWNNNGRAIAGRSPRGANISGVPLNQRRPLKSLRDQGEEFAGSVKARRPGSGANIAALPKSQRRRIRPMSDQGEEFTGYAKSRRPLKGGGSVSGKLWNNNESAIAARRPSGGANINVIPRNQRRTLKPMRDQGEEFTGYTKARRPLKGGGSVSGKLWNNSETPIAVRTPPATARREGEYTGNIKYSPYRARFRDQGEEFTGVIKLSRFRRNYVKNPNSAEESIRKARPEKGVYKVDGLQVKVERRAYVRNKNSSEEALLKLRPTRTTKEAGELQVKVEQYKYVRNKSSAEEALKVREPGKAFARATDYQGNIKMQKYRLFERNRELHPDAKFVKTNKNNVKQERDAVTNLKLWWARLFRKEETQPDHLKDNSRKPGYDKGEAGLWYDKHNQKQQ